jgi:hypothetical protein
MMGLEFLRDHGGRRVRALPEQPELDLPAGVDEEDEASVEEGVDHEYETAGKPWRPVSVQRSHVDWDEAPRRFVDGCHVGRTIAWLQDAEGHPVPLMLSEVGGVCVERDGRDLRRSFQVVERVVALVVDPFPWNEVEEFAIALAGSGFRLLPASSWEGEDRGWAVSYDFEAMRKKAQNRSDYEMQLLEEVALCQHAEIPTLVDGPLEPRVNRNQDLRKCPIVGVIKQQRRGYLHSKGWRVYYHLEPGQRTPAFLITTKSVPVVSWYLKLDGAHGALPNWGVVRVEIAEGYFERMRRDFGLINRLSHALIQMRCRLDSYRRGPVSLAPIVRAEEVLRALFAPPSLLAHQFYRLTGL